MAPQSSCGIGGSCINQQSINYDSKNRIDSYTVTSGAGHSDFNAIKRVKLNGTWYSEYTYDSLNRLVKTEHNIGNGTDTDYTYTAGVGNGCIILANYTLRLQYILQTDEAI